MLDILKKAVRELKKAGCETPQLDAEVLLAQALGCERFELYTNTNKCQPARHSFSEGGALTGQLAKFHGYIQRRKRREPVAYITGYKEFWSLKLKVTPDVLIPRPETETVVEKALEFLRHKKVSDTSPGYPQQVSDTFRILDLCTGSGAIAAALAQAFPQARFVAADISGKALAVAKTNLKFAQERVELLESDLFEKVEGTFDLIVSNPPYVPSGQIEELPPEISAFEPRLALDGGTNGLDFISQIRHHSTVYLKQEGFLILENGPAVETWKSSSSGAKCLSRVLST